MHIKKTPAFSTERTIKKTCCRAASSAQRRIFLLDTQRQIGGVLPAQECQVGKPWHSGGFQDIIGRPVMRTVLKLKPGGGVSVRQCDPNSNS
jgi:hypothetical protein